MKVLNRNEQSEEFKDVRNGLPAYDSKKRSKMLYLLLYAVMAIFLSTIVLLIGILDQTLTNLNISQIYFLSNFSTIITLIFLVAEQMFYIGLVSLTVGILQAWIFRDRVKSKVIYFMLIIIASGIFGGISAGVLSVVLKSIQEYLSTTIPFLGLGLIAILFNSINGMLIGVLAGAIIGVSSGFTLIWLLHNPRDGKKYFIYTFFSWVTILGGGWFLGFLVNGLMGSAYAGYAIGLFLIMIAHGIGLILFLHFTPQIEYS